MNDNVIQLVEEAAGVFAHAANVFAQLACELKDDRQQLDARIKSIETDSSRSRAALREIAESILKNLD